MTKKDNTKKSKSVKPKPAPKSVDFNLDGNMDKSNVVVGDSNVINNNYFPIVEKNVEKHEPDFWNLKHPYPMSPNFTGRVAEHAMLTQWLNGDNENRLFILRALGGFGKSALTWHWLTHEVDIKKWPKVVFWSFYEGDASFEGFIKETLKYLNIQLPKGGRPQVDELLKAMQAQEILLIIDGFERTLRAYSSMNVAYQGDEEPKLEDNQLDCVNLNAEIFLKNVCSLPNIKSKVLITTRLTPRVIKLRGEFMLACREEELTAMQKADVVEFFSKQKIKGTRAEIEVACAPYGYHPLTLRILAGLIINDRITPYDILVAKKLNITDDIIQNKNHVLEIAYNTLSIEQQDLLNNIACFRSPTNYAALKVISGVPLRRRSKRKGNLVETLNTNLQKLETHGLLQWDRQANKYDLHPIVRRYAYGRLTATNRIAAHIRLRDYFASIDVVAKPQNINDLAPVIELYHHTVQAGEFDKAIELFRDQLGEPLYFQLGAYYTVTELMRSLFLDGEDKPPLLGSEVWRGFALNTLANSYSLSGQPGLAIPAFNLASQMAKNPREGNIVNSAVSIGNVALDQARTGVLRAAESNIQIMIDFCHQNRRESHEAIGHYRFGFILMCRGMWYEALQELDTSLKQSQNQEQVQILGMISSYRSLCTMLMTRDNDQPKNNDKKSAIKFAQTSLEQAEETARIQYPIERDFVRAHWLLGTAYRLDGQLDLAEYHLSEAITRDRAINMVDYEADILLNIARLRYDQRNYTESKLLVDEAITITERSGYVLQGADVNLFLAQYALEQQKDKVKAKEYAQTALKLAYCDGPPYYYKVAYHEAERMLEKLK